mgnify:FL=1
MAVLNGDDAVAAAVPQAAGVKDGGRRADAAHQLPAVGVAEKRNIGPALTGGFSQTLARPS